MHVTLRAKVFPVDSEAQAPINSTSPLLNGPPPTHSRRAQAPTLRAMATHP